MLPDYKICSMCKINKPRDEYHTKKEKGGYIYLKSRCKKCSTLAKSKDSYNLCGCGDRKQKKSKTCSKCKADRTVTIEECYRRYKKHHVSSVFALVRDRARRKFKKADSKCQNCGYSKHVEVCHIKPISSFDRSTPIDDINSEDNVIILCPNCHWEFDKGLLLIGH